MVQQFFRHIDIFLVLIACIFTAGMIWSHVSVAIVKHEARISNA
ncbi:hypothetical protein BH10PLA2_BH10PLA2_11290 [soil metagenome]